MDLKDVEGLAGLARIELSAEEKKGLLSDLDGILKYVGQIEKIKGEKGEGRGERTNVWRKDETEPRDFSRELIISQFPDSQDGFLKVKKIL